MIYSNQTNNGEFTVRIKNPRGEYTLGQFQNEIYALVYYVLCQENNDMIKALNDGIDLAVSRFRETRNNYFDGGDK